MRGRRMKVYLASPLGFATSTRGFMADLVAALSPIVTIINPWDDHRFDAEIARAARMDSRRERQEILTRVNVALGQANEERIRHADAVVAVLDGVDVDSGTAAEIGFAYALGKPVIGLRTDFRLAGDNEAALVNLQVQYFIEASGGRIVTTVPELKTALASLSASR